MKHELSIIFYIVILYISVSNFYFYRFLFLFSRHILSIVEESLKLLLTFFEFFLARMWMVILLCPSLYLGVSKLIVQHPGCRCQFPQSHKACHITGPLAAGQVMPATTVTYFSPLVGAPSRNVSTPATGRRAMNIAH